LGKLILASIQFYRKIQSNGLKTSQEDYQDFQEDILACVLQYSCLYTIPAKIVSFRFFEHNLILKKLIKNSKIMVYFVKSYIITFYVQGTSATWVFYKKF